MNTITAIQEKVNEILVEEFEVDGNKISGTANLRETLGLDSLDYVDLVVAIEADFAGITTFEDFYNCIGSKMNP